MDFREESNETIDTVSLFKSAEEQHRKNMLKRLAVLSAVLSAGYFFLPSPVIAGVQALITAIKAYLTGGNP